MASRHPSPLPPTDPNPYYGASPTEPTLVYRVEGAPRRHRRGRRLLRALLIVLLLLLVLLGVGGAAVYEDPALLAPVSSALLGTQPGTVAWNGHDPVNILVMGVDQRTNEQTRSDSMIVMRVDPSSHDVKMLSVPRDLFVTIPSADPNRPYGQYKINAAYALGWATPQGQGPQYAALTVEDALHVPVNYYAVVKFAGFQSVIDAIGGVNVCVPQAINDDAYPADVGYGFDPLHIRAGCQKMDGTLALKYTRERHAYAQQDLGRVQAQQAVLEGITKGLFSPGTLLRAPGILAVANNALITNMPHSMLPQLGLLLARAKGAHMRHSYINQDGGYVQGGWLGDQLGLLGHWTKIWGLTTGLFADSQLQTEHATIQVRDGQHTAGLAALYTTVLGKVGFNTAGFAPRNADKSTYTRSLIVVNQDLPGADYTARLLAQLLQADVAYRHIGTDHAQIVAILGSQAAEGS